MKRLIKLFACMYLLVMFSSSVLHAAPILTDEQKKKIDNAFGSLLNKQYPELNIPEASPALLPKPTIENSVEYYDVLIYTYDEAAIKNSNIKTGASVKMKNDTYAVTAKVSLAQIIELAKMPQVTLIKASKTMSP